MKNADAADRSTPHPALAELHEIEEALRADSRGIGDLLRENPSSQLLRRVYIKTLITGVEGHLFAFKQAMPAFEEILCSQRHPRPHRPHGRKIQATLARVWGEEKDEGGGMRDEDGDAAETSDEPERVVAGATGEYSSTVKN